MREIALIALILVVGMAGGCASTDEVSASYLDAETGVTVRRAGTPIVLYKDRTSRAAFARDFIHMGPVQVNRMGNYRYYLWFGIWSTIPEVDPAAQRDGFESVTLFVNGEPLQLQLAGWTGTSIGASSDVYVKPVASAADAYFEVTLDQVRLIAGANDLRILTSGPDPTNFELWDNQASAFRSLRQFTDQAAY
jgi:hypothetical protein